MINLLLFKLITNRVYGSNDIELGICVSEHIFKERDEQREGCGWDELLCLPLYVISFDSHPFCHCCGGPTYVGYWLAKSNFSDWTQLHMVTLFTHYINNSIFLRLSALSN